MPGWFGDLWDNLSGKKARERKDFEERTKAAEAEKLKAAELIAQMNARDAAVHAETERLQQGRERVIVPGMCSLKRKKLLYLCVNDPVNGWTCESIKTEQKFLLDGAAQNSEEGAKPTDLYKRETIGKEFTVPDNFHCPGCGAKNVHLYGRKKVTHYIQCFGCKSIMCPGACRESENEARVFCHVCQVYIRIERDGAIKTIDVMKVETPGPNRSPCVDPKYAKERIGRPSALPSDHQIPASNTIQPRKL